MTGLRLWASAHGIQACRAHGMAPKDIFLADAERVGRLGRGLRGDTVEVVGGLPENSHFRVEWFLADFVAEYHPELPDCPRCAVLRAEEEAR